MRERAIREGVAALGQQLPDGATARLAALLSELERWNRRINLTAIRDPDAMVSAHILDSLAVRPLLCGPRVIDIGTGAGFPGLPLAIAEPELDFVLLDGNGRKIGFVRHVVAELGIGNVVAEQVRAEDYAPATGFDTVTARALAPLPRLVGLSDHLLREGGQLLALKGKYPAEELESIERSSDWNLSVLQLTVPGLAGHSRHVVRMQRASRYPVSERA